MKDRFFQLAALLLLSLIFPQAGGIASPSDVRQSAHSGAKVTLSTKGAHDVARIVGILSRKGYRSEIMRFKMSRDTAECTFPELPTGTWHIKINAHNARGKIIYTGESDFRVFPGSTTPVNILLLPTTGSAKVTARWGQNKAHRNMAIAFDGRSGYVLFHSGRALRPQTFTVEVAIKFDTLGEFVPILEEFSSDLWTHADGYSLSYERGGIGFGVAQAANLGMGTDVKFNLPLHTWIRIAGTYDGHRLCLYVDGNLISEKDYSTPVYYGNHEFALGAAYHSHFGGWHYFSGEMDELRIWDYPRSQEEIYSDLTNDLTGNEAGLVGYWNFDQNRSDRMAIDRTRNSNNGALVGGVEFVPVDSF